MCEDNKLDEQMVPGVFCELSETIFGFSGVLVNIFGSSQSVFSGGSERNKAVGQKNWG